MANEIKFARSTGLTRTLIVAQGQTYWNASSMQADYDSAVTNGKLTCTEHDGSGIYYADMPAVAAGKYVMIVLDESDVYEGAFDFNWNGTIEIGVDVGSIDGSAQSLTDLKHFADSGYDPATSKVQGVVLVDTTTTNTDMAAAFTEIKGATWSSTTDTLEAIRDRGDAAWTTGTLGSAVNLQIEGGAITIT